MTEAQFLRYVGPADLHDARIVAIEESPGTVNVRIETLEGRHYLLEFAGVTVVEADQADGLLLYALAELSDEPPLRRFSFVPWDEGEDGAPAARLVIRAISFTWVLSPKH